MRVRAQARPEMARLADALETHGIAMLVLPEPPGLVARPMTPLECDREGAIWFMTSRTTMAPLIGAEGSALNLSFADDAQGSYISITAHGELVDDAQRKEDLWTVAGRPWFDGPNDPDLTLLRVQPLHAEIWDGPHGKLTRLLVAPAAAPDPGDGPPQRHPQAA